MSPGRDGVPGTPSKGKGRRSKLAPHDEVPGTPKLKKLVFPKAAPWPLSIVLRMIQSIYHDKILADIKDDGLKQARMDMREYVAEWMDHQYGLDTLSKEAQGRLCATLKAFRHSNAYCATFGRLWNVFAPLEPVWCDMYLEVLRPIVEAPALNPGAEIVVTTKLNMNVMVKKWFALDAALKAFADDLEPRHVAELTARFAAASQSFGKRGEKYIDQEVALTICMDERRALQGRNAQMVKSLFEAGDVNDNGSLDLQEFATIVRYINPTTKMETIERMYHDSGGEGSHAADDFARVVESYGLLSTRIARRRLRSPLGALGGDDVINDTVVAELHAKWERRAAEMAARVAAVEDETLRARLQAKIARHAVLLDVGEDNNATAIARSLAVAAVLAASFKFAPVRMVACMKIIRSLKRWAKRARNAVARRRGF